MPKDTERICPICGYQPMDGRDGFHSCRERLHAKEILDALKLDITGGDSDEPLASSRVP